MSLRKFAFQSKLLHKRPSILNEYPPTLALMLDTLKLTDAAVVDLITSRIPPSRVSILFLNRVDLLRDSESQYPENRHYHGAIDLFGYRSVNGVFGTSEKHYSPCSLLKILSK